MNSPLPEDQSLSGKGWRYKLGLVLFITPFPIFFATPVIIPLLELSAAETGALIGGILLAVEVVWFASIPLLGKAGFMALKNKAFGWLKLQDGPISYKRHVLGVWLLVGSVLAELVLQGFALYVSYINSAVDGAMNKVAGLTVPEFNTVYLVIEVLTAAGIVASLFILGGDFWERLKAAFEWQGRESS